MKNKDDVLHKFNENLEHKEEKYHQIREKKTLGKNRIKSKEISFSPNRN